MFGGKKGKMDDAIWEQEQAQKKQMAGEYWNTYGTWLNKEREGYEKDLANAKTTFGDDEEKYDSYLSQRKAAYDKSIGDLQSTEQGRFLTDYIEEQNQISMVRYGAEKTAGATGVFGDTMYERGDVTNFSGIDQVMADEIAMLEGRFKDKDIYQDDFYNRSADDLRYNELTSLRDAKPELETDPTKFYTSMFGDPQAPAASTYLEEAGESDSAKRARRAASGGSSPWW